MQEIEKAMIEYCRVVGDLRGLEGKDRADFECAYLRAMYNSWLGRFFLFLGKHWALFDRFYAKGIRREYLMAMEKKVKEDDKYGKQGYLRK